MIKIITSRPLRIIALFICIAIIIYEASVLYRDNKEYEVADSEYDTLIEKTVQLPPETAVAPKEDEEPTYPFLQIDYTLLKSINDNFVAWLYFPYLEINYPVVHENVVDEYLHTTFDGTPNNSGCLFTDILSSRDFSGKHDIIFGHNMRNGSMFGSLKKLNQGDNMEMIKENPYVYIYTEDNVIQYKIFAFYITKIGSNSYSVVTTNQEYDTFLDYIKANTIYEIPGDIDFNARPSILTLSTCSGKSGSGKRFVIHAAKINSWSH